MPIAATTLKAGINSIIKKSAGIKIKSNASPLNLIAIAKPIKNIKTKKPSSIGLPTISPIPVVIMFSISNTMLATSDELDNAQHKKQIEHTHNH